VIEVRRMRATDTELKSLICNLMASEENSHGSAGQAFKITDMNYVSTKPVKLHVTGQHGDDRPISLTVTPDLLIAAFVIFCTGQGIPISRQSVKTVAKVRDGVAFDMVVRNLAISETASAHHIRYAFLPAGHTDTQTMMGLHLK